AATFVLFKPDREGLRLFRRRKRVTAAPEAPAAIRATPIVLPMVTLRTDFGARTRQFQKLAWFDTRGVLRGVPFLVMLAFGLSNLGANLAFMGEIYGTSVWPVTHLMAQNMSESFTFLLVIIVGFYAGELVWRERGDRISEVTDSFPIPDWIPLLAKTTTLAMVIVAFLVAGSL